MQQLSIAIGRAGGVLTFTPQTLNAFTGDQIFWINNDTHPQQPAVVNPNGSTVAIVDSIPAGQTSDVFTPVPQKYDASGNPLPYTITYICLGTPAVQGTIAVTANP